ncbi:golgi family SNAP receptor complex member 1 [Sporothrix schenckii 1099-18]|uniref:Golgi SNAP receptor complex member 1 n=1 Tax=Sporothrix schenckii 1099-18 TaxID=1397361 RepID=A0A0F2M6J5_SPOSC|nr:golgi family SNAP receptor complex member 1 [Sporothrix schenckii 1099-18]KJR84425.1 golgi family SNAP receptor complex member 1 [Sporothrix schenckii 1099-18]
MASAGGNSGWTQLRQQVRTLESQFSATSSIPLKPSDEEKQTEKKLEEILSKRENLIRQLTRILDSDPNLTASAVKQNNLALLREKYEEHRRDLSRLKVQLNHARDRVNLMAHVRNDINSHRAGADGAEGGGLTGEAAEAEYMLGERSRIDNSHNMVDSVLSQAYAVNENFGLQRETLTNINRRITLAASQVPGINTLIGRISSKKRRDGIIMGSFIALCFIVFFWFM